MEDSAVGRWGRFGICRGARGTLCANFEVMSRVVGRSRSGPRAHAGVSWAGARCGRGLDRAGAFSRTPSSRTGQMPIDFMRACRPGRCEWETEDPV